MNPVATTAPLLKWPGGKRSLVRHLLPHIPPDFGRYFEPFLGGGALFFALQPRQATLADQNGELINCYLQVRDHPDDVIDQLSRLRNTEEDYYRVRNTVRLGKVYQAARLIYLVTLSFNGIYRVNLQGKFNVPYGHKGYLQPCDPDRIRSASKALCSADLAHMDFEATTINAKRGDVVYLDPPYTVAHGNNGFVKYNARIFSWSDQVRLATVADKLARRGCRVLVSNADHPSIHDLYSNFTVVRIARPSVIAASSSRRREITECIFQSKE